MSPRMFKQLFGKGHAEFSTARQQDAYEYLTLTLNLNPNPEPEP